MKEYRSRSSDGVMGTVFLTEDAEGEPVIGIETDEFDLFIEECDDYEELQQLEGEAISATGSIWIDESGDRWLDLVSFDLLIPPLESAS